jgi:hypothetical protein
LLPDAAGEERQVIAQDIDRDGSHTEEQGNPNAPITVRTGPVGTLDRLNNFAFAAFVAVMTVYNFAHLDRCLSVALSIEHVWGLSSRLADAALVTPAIYAAGSLDAGVVLRLRQ